MQLLKQSQVLLMLVVMLALQACGTANPIARADTVEQKAYAAYGTFVIVEEQAAKAVTSGELPRSVVVQIGNADARAKPVADDLLEATLEFETIRQEYESCSGAEDCETKEDQLMAGIQNLDGWVSRLVPLVNNLKSAVQGGQ